MPGNTTDEPQLLSFATTTAHLLFQNRMLPVPSQHATLEVLAIVTGAISQDPVVLRASTGQLEEILERPGTLEVLQEIAARWTVPLAIRQLCIRQVENNIKHW